jgi:hypothetical protein
MQNPSPEIQAMRIHAFVSTIATALAASMFMEPAAAQSNDAGLIGTWVLDAAESDFGMSPAPDSAHTVITRADDERLVLTRKVWAGMAGHRDVEFDQATDGTAAEAQATDGAVIPSRAWWESDDLMIEVEVESNMGEIIVTDRLTLVGDDQLIIDRTMDVPSVGEVTQMLVHIKR